jgi:two-component system, chemotaxis family, sensor kinase CheA
MISDSLELMQNIKDVLLSLQQTPTDTAIASTIPSTTQAMKDMTNFYGCKHVVALLCVIEGVLHRVRVAELRPKADLIALLLICCDHVSRMVRQFANRDEIYLGYLKRSHGLIRQLRAYHRNKFEHDAAA